jgi:tetratricopeptide (TPR) repeat protein
MVETTGAGGRRRRLAALAGALLIVFSLPAVAQSSADDLARKHFESGVAYLQESDYPSALRAFQKAFELSKRAEILINIATVHERAGDLPAAVGSLERYLELEPSGKHADTVKLRLANLQKRIEPPPPDPEAGPGEPEPEPEPESAPATAPPPPVLAAAERREPNRLPAYVAFGVGGLAAAGAVLTGVFAQREYDAAENRCAPACTDGDVAPGENLAIASTILTGVAVVGVGVGAVLWFTADSSEAAASSARLPRFDLRVGAAPGSARAHALWRF